MNVFLIILFLQSDITLRYAMPSMEECFNVANHAAVQETYKDATLWCEATQGSTK